MECKQQEETGSGGRRGQRGYGGRGYVPKVRHHLRVLHHGGGSPGISSPEVPVGTTDKEDTCRRKCHIDRQGRHIKNIYGRTKGHPRERVLFPPTMESNPESIYYDGSTILRNRATAAAGQGGTRSLPDDQVEYGETKVVTHKHGKCSTNRETTPRQIYQRVREFPNETLCERTTAVLQLPEVCPDLKVLHRKTHIQPVQAQQKIAHYSV